MLVYLIKFTRNGKTGYKGGVSKWGKHNLLDNRFGDQYSDNLFYQKLDTIEVLEAVQFSRDSYIKAKFEAERAESAFLKQWKKSPDFCVESYFGWERDELGYIGGVTEMIFLDENQSESDLIDDFKAKTAHLAA